MWNFVYVIVEAGSVLREGGSRMKPEGEGWITTKQAARILGLCVKTVHNLVDAGKLERVVDGRQGYLCLAAVEAMARDPARLRRRANAERRLVKRRTAA